jgi:hypothetical protein
MKQPNSRLDGDAPAFARASTSGQRSTIARKRKANPTLYAPTLLAAIAVAIPMTMVSPSVASAGDTLVTHRELVVCEHQNDVDTGTYVRSGDRVVISASGTIDAGWWFIGDNGPQGLWFNGGQDYPAPGEPADSLLYRTGGSYNFAGTGTDFVSEEPGNRLRFRINDNVPGNGSGCFNVAFDLYR